MSKALFVRGARVKPPHEDPPLTMSEAALVMVDVSKRFGGITNLRDFLTYMGRAWVNYERVADSALPSQEPK